jgi:hypothetical protein
MLEKKMGSAADRCFFSFANLIVAAVMNHFGRAVFWLKKHETANAHGVESILDHLKAHESTDKRLTHLEIEKAGAQARIVCGNTHGVPVFCRQEIALDENGQQVTRSLKGLLDYVIVCPPVFHCQVCRAR